MVRITGNLVETFKECCPLRTRRSPREKPWLTGDLINLGRDVRRLFNRARRKKLSVYWDDYHSKLREYNYKIRTAKRNSWKLFCEQVDSVSEVSRIKKFLSKTHTQPETLVDSNGRRADTMEQSLRILMEAHFLGDRAGTNGDQLEPRAEDALLRGRILDTCVGGHHMHSNWLRNGLNPGA